MSIIADTLNRLQAQPPAELSEDFANQPQGQPTSCKREPGWHARPSRSRFWWTLAGMTVGFLGIGLSAFWIGLNLNMGLANPQPSPLSALDSPRTASTSMEHEPDVEDNQITVASPSPKTLIASASALPDQPPEPKLPASVKSQDISGEPPKSNTNSLASAGDPHPPFKRSDQGTTVASNSSRPATSIAETVDSLAREEPPHPSTKITHESKKMAGTLPVSDHRPSFPHEPQPAPGTKAESQPTEGSQTLTVSMNEEAVVGGVFSDKGNAPEPFHSTFSTDTPLPSDVSETQHRANEAPFSEPDRGNFLKRAQELIQAGQYEEAVTWLTPLFLEPPHRWEPWFWMGTAYLGKGDLKQADQFFLSGLARNNKVPQLWIQRALVAQQQGDFQLALQELRQAESLQPGLPHLHLNMGYAYDRLGNDRLAIQHYGKFLQLTDGNPVFFLTREKLLARLTRRRGADHSILKGEVSQGTNVPFGEQ